METCRRALKDSLNDTEEFYYVAVAAAVYIYSYERKISIFAQFLLFASQIQLELVRTLWKAVLTLIAPAVPKQVSLQVSMQRLCQKAPHLLSPYM